MDVRTAIVILGLVLCVGVTASADIIDFNDLDHGEILTDQYLASHGVTFSAWNYGSYDPSTGAHPDITIGFDTTEQSTADPDLEGPPYDSWVNGNIDSDENLGTIFILAENEVDTSPADGLIDSPDDEAYGGSITLSFDTYLTSFGFDFIDAEASENFYVRFYDGSTLLDSVNFNEFQDPSSPYYTAGIVRGDHTANRVDTIYASDVGGNFDTVKFYYKCATGGFDNVSFQKVPEPATVALFVIGMAGLGYIRRRNIGKKPT